MKTELIKIQHDPKILQQQATLPPTKLKILNKKTEKKTPKHRHP